MALTAGDWTIDRATGNIRYGGGDHDGTGGTPSYATVLEFHRWLQGLADDAIATAADEDELDITNTNPSQRSTDNIVTLINDYNIDDASSEHIYDGSIVQNGGDDIYDGIVNFGNADVQIQLIQNGAIIADDWWNYSAAGLNADANSGISHRFIIKVRSGGTDTDSRKLIGTCRRFGYTYAEFNINSTARGNNVLALADASDLNNATVSGTVAGWSAGFSNTEGYANLDIDNDSTDEYYYSEWNIDTGTYDVNDFYEYTKYLTREGSTETVYGLNGELFRGITHQVALSSGSGTWVEPESLSWTGGTGQLLAVDNTTGTSSTVMYIQLLTGVAPTGTITGNGSADATVGTVTERTISKPFCGASTGSAIIGSYGLGIVQTDLTSSDQLTALDTFVYSPPNNVTNTISGLVSGEDRVLVAPYDGASTDTNGDPAIEKDQLSLATALSSNDETSIVVTEAIPDYTPSSGYIRVTDDNGYEKRIKYSSVDTGSKTFTIDSSYHTTQTDNQDDFGGVDGSGTYQATIGNDIYIAYIDEEASGTTASFTSVHAAAAAAMNLVIIVRDGGGTPIKQYIAPWTQTDSSTSASVIRTSDT